MPSVTDNAMTLWTWPLAAAQWNKDVIDMMFGAQRVVAARLPTIAAAMQNPLAADHVELSRMVTEKVGAFTTSGKSIGVAGDAVQRAGSANAKAIERMAQGKLLWPSDWMRLAESNLAAAAAVASLPTAALAPLQAGVKANDTRLRR
ncbi:hypothetical protein PX554_05765 [Sphingomonas sp. H39-1-10]|uniref:hypothetical protein n=1 Tax=Sphingomonas TaxID=13687 RepID=UPI00088DCDB2|nr:MULTISPECIES: hypothetical protein [Sphingomonas]MDF0487629.1 hypothetical protein [Sphingomonas pollutisoli]SDA17094.1 hypothetical protein SAMN03159340_01016 [Sphingomonas sp. NFR15]